MSKQKISTRYAAALISMTKNQIPLEDSLADGLSQIALLYEDKSLRKVLASPIVSSDLLDEVFSYASRELKADPILKQFLDVLVQSRRTSLIPLIAKSYKKKLQHQRGVVDALVTTALPLDETELNDIQRRLESMLNKKVKLETRVDRSILGGFVVRVENSLLDMSLKTKLENMTKIAAS
jgi:ATP synthase F1 delta subunit